MLAVAVQVRNYGHREPDTYTVGWGLEWCLCKVHQVLGARPLVVRKLQMTVPRGQEEGNG
jgi:hypothetical protein